jgi:hypothetical protein
MSEVIQVLPAQNVTIKLASVCTGWSEKAIRRKIEDGIWLEGREYFRTPDKCIMVNLKGVTKWVEKAPA